MNKATKRSAGTTPTDARAIVAMRSIVSARPIYGTNAPSRATTARGPASGTPSNNIRAAAQQSCRRGQQGGSPDVAADLVDRAYTTGHQRLTSPAVGRGQHPVPGLVPVHQQEERQETTKDGDGDDVGRRIDDVSEPGKDESPDRLGDALQDRHDLGWDAERRQLRSNGADPGIERTHDRGQRRDQCDDDRCDRRTDHEERREGDHTGSLAAAPPTCAPFGYVWSQCGGKDQGEDDRRHDDRQLPGDREQDHPECERDQDPPADVGEAHEPAGNQPILLDRGGAGRIVNHGVPPAGGLLGRRPRLPPFHPCIPRAVPSRLCLHVRIGSSFEAGDCHPSPARVALHPNRTMPSPTGGGHRTTVHHPEEAHLSGC